MRSIHLQFCSFCVLLFAYFQPRIIHANLCGTNSKVLRRHSSLYAPSSIAGSAIKYRLSQQKVVAKSRDVSEQKSSTEDLLQWLVGLKLQLLQQLLPQSSGESTAAAVAVAKQQLFALTARCRPNGSDASRELRTEIDSAVRALEAVNPTRRPAYSPLMNGFWKMCYTDFQPAAPSSGNLGPFTGDVYQDLDATAGVIKNILDVKFPPIRGALIARQSVADSCTWAIEFDRVGNKIANLVSLPGKKFAPGSEIRLWEISYLDSDTRIVRARRQEAARSDAFVFLLRRLEDDERIQIDV